MLSNIGNLKGIASIAQKIFDHHFPDSRAIVEKRNRPFRGPNGRRDYRILSKQSMVPSQVELEIQLDCGISDSAGIRRIIAFEAELNDQLPLNVSAYTTCHKGGSVMTPITRLGRARLGGTLLIGGRMTVDKETLATVEEVIKLVNQHKDDENGLRQELNALLKRDFKEDDVLGPETMNGILKELRALRKLVSRHDAEVTKLRGLALQPYKDRPGL